jgi:hypothetical protein
VRADTGPDTVSWRSERMLARSCDSCACAWKPALRRPAAVAVRQQRAAATAAFVAAVQQELADDQALARQLRPQAAIAQLDAVDHRAQRQVVAPQRSGEFGLRPRAGT